MSRRSRRAHRSRIRRDVAAPIGHRRQSDCTPSRTHAPHRASRLYSSAAPLVLMGGQSAARRGRRIFVVVIGARLLCSEASRSARRWAADARPARRAIPEPSLRRRAWLSSSPGAAIPVLRTHLGHYASDGNDGVVSVHRVRGMALLVGVESQASAPDPLWLSRAADIVRDLAQG